MPEKEDFTLIIGGQTEVLPQVLSDWSAKVRSHIRLRLYVTEQKSKAIELIN